MVSDRDLVETALYGDRVRVDRPTVTLPAPLLVSFSVNFSVAPGWPTALSWVALARMVCPAVLLTWYDFAARTAV